jgi:hypothetical protein
MAVTAAEPGRRRMLVGANVILQIALVMAAVIGLIAMAPTFSRQVDVTRTASNSLSQRTIQMLRNLPQDVRISAIYAVTSDLTEEKDRRERVRDLLDLYDREGGSKVTSFVIDPYKERERVTELLKRLRELPTFKDEGKPQSEALDSFKQLAGEIATQFAEDAKQLEPLGAADPRAKLVLNTLRDVSTRITELVDSIEEERRAEVPRYGTLLDRIREQTAAWQADLKGLRQWLTTEAPGSTGATPQLQEYFKQAASRYEALGGKVDALLARMKDLKQTKLEEVVTTLKQWERNRPPILVETNADAKVIPFDDVWPVSRDPDASASREFAGEQVISSAILHLTQKEKTSVVFVRYGLPSLLTPDYSQITPQMIQSGQMPEAPLQDLSQLLEKSNFTAQEWDLTTVKEAPAVAADSHVIYVVTPPAPPQQNRMQPTPQPGISDADRTAVANAVAKSGMAIFLVPADTPDYGYADYLRKTWGIDPQNQLILAKVTAVGEPGQDSRFAITAVHLDSSTLRFTNQEIGRPMQSLPIGLAYTAPLKTVTGDDAPKNVKLEPIAETTSTDTLWAVSNFQLLQREQQRQRGLKPSPDMPKGPFTVAYAAETDDHKRAVIFGSFGFILDQIAGASQPVIVGGTFRSVKLFPGNTELFINALHWVSGNAERIAVGPRGDDVPRLTKLSPGAETNFWKIFLIGVWPALILLVGAGVYMLRRR